MAMNPMQRKANNYLLIGILGTLLVTGAIIVILFMQMNKLNEEIKTNESKLQEVFVLNKNVESGGEIKQEDLKKMKVSKTAVPSNYIGSVDEGTLAKINLNSGTVLTKEMIYTEKEEISSDVREQEYNMISLQTKMESGDFVDIRLKLPNGTDYIVISKKQIEIPEIGGIPSISTIRVKIAEEETLLMSNAIVEAYWNPGSTLYATKYVEAGMQNAATPTYLPNDAVMNAIAMDPNIVAVAKNTLAQRYNQTDANGTRFKDYIRSHVDSTYTENSAANVQTGIQDEISKAREERQAYLDALGGN